MYGLRESIHIRRSQQDVWAIVHDLPNLPTFWVGIARWEPVGGAQASVGDRYWLLMNVGAIKAGGQIQITEVQPPRTIAWESERGTEHLARITVDPEGDGSRVTLEANIRLQGPSWITERVAGRIVRRNLAATLEQLRHHCEYELPRPS